MAQNKDYDSAAKNLIGTMGKQSESILQMLPKSNTPDDTNNVVEEVKTKRNYKKKAMERKFQISMGEELYQELLEEAAADGMPLNTYIRYLLMRRPSAIK